MHIDDFAPLMRQLEAENAYLNLPARPGHTPALIAVGGLPGSGKSTLGLRIAAELEGIQLRADAIRKHVGGVPLNQRGPASRYTPEHSKLANEHLLSLARTLLSQNWNVIVDASHAHPMARQKIEDLAWSTGIEFKGLWCHAPAHILRQRVEGRTGDVSDADLAILNGFIKRSGDHVPSLSTAWDVIDASRTPDEMAAQALSLIQPLAYTHDRC